MTRDHDIYYLITEKPPLFWVGASLAAVLAVFGVFLFVVLRVRWIYSVPLLLLEGRAPSAAMSGSRELIKGNTWRVALIYFSVALIMLVGGAIGPLAQGRGPGHGADLDVSRQPAGRPGQPPSHPGPAA